MTTFTQQLSAQIKQNRILLLRFKATLPHPLFPLHLSLTLIYMARVALGLLNSTHWISNFRQRIYFQIAIVQQVRQIESKQRKSIEKLNYFQLIAICTCYTHWATHTHFTTSYRLSVCRRVLSVWLWLRTTCKQLSME